MDGRTDGQTEMDKPISLCLWWRILKRGRGGGGANFRYLERGDVNLRKLLI